MMPKFIMAGGQLVKVLIHTGVANYMEFKPVDGSFVYSSSAAKVCKVPATPEDAMKSSLMSMMEKTRMVQFTLWVSKCKLSDRSTWKAGTISKKDLKLDTMTGTSAYLGASLAVGGHVGTPLAMVMLVSVWCFRICSARNPPAPDPCAIGWRAHSDLQRHLTQARHSSNTGLWARPPSSS